MSEKYCERAEQCIQDAEEAVVPELRPLFLAIAQCWLRLAQLAEHSGRMQQMSNRPTRQSELEQRPR
jgi:hypothetical protein